MKNPNENPNHNNSHKNNHNQLIKKDKSLLKTFISTMFLIVAVGVILSSVTAIVYSKLMQQSEYPLVARSTLDISVDSLEEEKNNAAENNEPANKVNNKSNEKKGGLFSSAETLVTAPRKTNVLILGLDQSSLLSDVIILGSLDTLTKQIDLISIPRDTYITISEEEVKEIKKTGSNYVPKSGNMKLTDLHSYAGKENGHKYSIRQVEDMLDIHIDYYMEIDLKGFKYIVDEVGGIYMDIPKGGLKYNDPYQNLSINVPGGRVLLDGKLAEGVVRYRHNYAQGDLDRIEVQKRFMKEFFSQVLDKETIMKNIPSFFSLILSYVKTDFGVDDLLKYLPHIPTINADKINFYTLPGEAKYVNGGWYYFYDKQETIALTEKTILNLSDTETAIREKEEVKTP